MVDFGGQLRRVREFLGMSQDDLARASGISQGAVSRFEAGRGLNTPFLGVLRLNMALARALRAIDQSTLTPEVQRFVRNMELYAEPVHPDGTSAPATFDSIPLTSDPDLERVIRLIRELPEGRRATFMAVLIATATALSE